MQEPAVGRLYGNHPGHLKRFGTSIAHLLITHQQTLDTIIHYLGVFLLKRTLEVDVDQKMENATSQVEVNPVYP